MVKLIFFGHDARDAAVQRRIKAFVDVGAEVEAFTMRRGAPVQVGWRNVDLGETRDAAFGQRIGALIAARPTLRAHRETLRAADIFYARNLDMLALAHWARGMSGSRARLVYECLDVHRFLARGDALGAGFRTAEAALIGGVALVVVSSPAFVSEYFDKRHPGRVRSLLVENRLPPGFDYGPRPSAMTPSDGKLRIGWFGNLRCERSLSLLLDLAARFPDAVEISMRGAPAHAAIADFNARVSGLSNVRFGGRYAWPQDLAAIYRDTDVVWAGDFHDAGANSKWLLPNRLYEGGYYGAPPLAPADSETGRWIDTHGFGFTLTEPLEETLPGFVRSLGADKVARARERLLAAPMSVFVQPKDELQAVIDAALASPVR
ncbi:MAG TPA: glycosyl transferase [Candidatus Binatia bacterium]|nr:glycosyl transferase [Candidatus Binatia bacterium]